MEIGLGCRGHKRGGKTSTHAAWAQAGLALPLSACGWQGRITAGSDLEQSFGVRNLWDLFPVKLVQGKDIVGLTVVWHAEESFVQLSLTSEFF